MGVYSPLSGAGGRGGEGHWQYRAAGFSLLHVERLTLPPAATVAVSMWMCGPEEQPELPL